MGMGGNVSEYSCSFTGTVDAEKRLSQICVYRSYNGRSHNSFQNRRHASDRRIMAIKVNRICFSVMTGAAAMLLSACNGLFSSVYDTPDADTGSEFGFVSAATDNTPERYTLTPPTMSAGHTSTSMT